MTAILTLDRVARTYSGTPAVNALRSCTFDLNRGDFMTIVGPSGSGKSTLLNLVGLLDRPTSGTYTLLGEDVSKSDEAARSAIRARSIGFVFQAFQLLEYRQAVENVMMASLYRGVSEAEAFDSSIQALASVGLAAKAHTLTNLLSGGERQRVAIARALAGNPALLLADEPTGNLDTANATEIMNLFRELNDHGTTVMLITHDPSVAAAGNRQLSILDGIVSDRTADD